MIKKLTFVFVLSLILVPLRAQLLHRFLKSIDEVEIVAGPSLVSFGGVADSKLNRTKIGYTMGFASNWNVGARFAISAKLLYERKGINRHYHGQYFDEATQQFKMGDSKSSWNFDYLSLPVTLKYTLNRKKNIFIEEGFYIAYLQKAQVIDKYLYNNTQFISSQKGSFAQFDFGFTSSLGYSLTLKRNLLMNARLFGTYGIINISHYDVNTDFHIVRTKSIGVIFSIARKSLLSRGT